MRQFRPSPWILLDAGPRPHGSPPRVRAAGDARRCLGTLPSLPGTGRHPPAWLASRHPLARAHRAVKTTIEGTSLYEATAGRVRRLRRWLGLPADPPLRRPAARALPPIRRSWVAAVLQARSAVLARLSLDEYLRARLARYLLELPVPRSRLPLQIEVAGGEILSRRGTAPSPDATGAQAADAWAS